MILSDTSIHQRLSSIVPLVEERDASLVNPASLDIRIGEQVIIEGRDGSRATLRLSECSTDNHGPGHLWLHPGQFFLVETLEWLCCPLDLAFDLRLKSSRAREGFNHSLAFWVDPGWEGRLTMEITNLNQYRPLLLKHGMKFAQLVFYILDQPSAKPYAGRYKGAKGVEVSKAPLDEINYQARKSPDFCVKSIGCASPSDCLANGFCKNS